MTLENIYSILSKVLVNKVFYGINIYDNSDNASMPYIVYQEVTKRPIGYSDNKPIYYRSNVQITLVTKRKDKKLEQNLEKELLKNELSFSLIGESINSDKSINRVYEINMEEF